MVLVKAMPQAQDGVKATLHDGHGDPDSVPCDFDSECEIPHHRGREMARDNKLRVDVPDPAQMNLHGHRRDL